jgi:hypothetical protein
VEDLGLAAPSDADPDHVEADRRPALLLAGQPHSGEPAKPAHLLWWDGLRQTAEAVTGAGLDLDEHHSAVGIFGDDVDLAVPAAPVARHDSQSQ